MKFLNAKKPFFRYNHDQKGAGGFTMRKFAAALLLILGFSSVAKATDIVLSSSVFNGPIATNTVVDLDLDFYHVDQLAVQLNVSSGLPAAVTFTDGQTSTAALTVANLASLSTSFATINMTVTQAAAIPSTATVIIISTTGLSGKTITFGSKIITADTDFVSSGVSTITAAARLSAVLQGYTTLFISTSMANTGVVVTTAVVAGDVGNSLVLQTNASTNNITLSGSFFNGGRNKSLSGQTITVVANGTTTALKEGSAWSQLDVASNTAVSLKNAMNNAFSSIFISTVQTKTTIIYSTAVAVGSAQNAWTVASSTGAISVISSHFLNGQDAAVLKIGNFTFTANQDYFVTTSTNGTTVNIASAIANGKMGAMMSATANATNIIGATSTVVGAWTNFVLQSSTPSALTWSQAAMTRGVDSDIIYSTYQFQNGQFANYTDVMPNNSTAPLNSINKFASGWARAMPVLLSKTAGTYPKPLVDQTTYFAMGLTSQGFQLSATSSSSIAGVPIFLTTSSNVGAGTFTLTPLTLTGTPTFKLQQSNDQVNFFDFYASTVTNGTATQLLTSFPSPYTAVSTLWNIGSTYVRWLRFVFTPAGSAGGDVNVNYIVNGKRVAN